MAARKHTPGVMVPPVRLDSKTIAANAKAEAKATERLTARAAPPETCRPEIAPAPARGPIEAVPIRETYFTEHGSIRTRNAGEGGRTAARRRDVFDRMAHAAAIKAKGKPHEPPFSKTQVETARAYAALWERHQCAGVKCSSLEAQSGGGGQGSYIDAVLRDGERLATMAEAIGRGYAIEPKRASRTSLQRRAIPVLHVVERVCCRDMALADVLTFYGWAPDGNNLTEVRHALRDALDRIYGM